PVVTGTPLSATVQGCDATAAAAAVTTVSALETLLGITIDDACTPDANLVVTSGEGCTGTCPLVITRTYTIKDACGNTATVIQTINVEDTQAPVVTGTPLSATVQGCDATAAAAAVTTVSALETLLGITIDDACTPDANLVV